MIDIFTLQFHLYYNNMNKIFTLILCLSLCLISNAQVVKFVNYKYQSDVKVYLTDYSYQADATVFVTPYRYQAKDKLGYWFVSSSNYGAVKVYITKHKYEADVLVYISEWKYKVKYNGSYIKNLKLKQ